MNDNLPEYLEVFPRRMIGIYLDGGGGGTTNTQAQMMPWAKYVPPETYAAYRGVMPQVMAKYGQGLSPQERQQYSGQILSDTAKQFSGAETGLMENLARSGVKGGAATEAYSDLARGKAIAGAGGLSQMVGMDIQRKDINLDNIQKFIGLPSAPIQVGSTSTSTPAGWS